jgi:hypothetical protein
VTAPSRPPLVRVTARTADMLRRCYRGQLPPEVLERALVMLATADGHLDPSGRIKNGRHQ